MGVGKGCVRSLAESAEWHEQRLGCRLGCRGLSPVPPERDGIARVLAGRGRALHRPALQMQWEVRGVHSQRSSCPGHSAHR